MDISISGADIAIRTPFAEGFDLTQVLRGMAPTAGDRNDPVDFRLAGLVRRGHRDIWHVDRVLAFSTDECSPFVINGEDVGGNHGHPCGMGVRADRHGLSLRDVGTYWTDETGLGWTLLRIVDQDGLLFLSDNTGPSETDYAFANAIAGRLARADGCTLIPAGQHPGQQLTPAIRRIRCDVAYEQHGAWQPLRGGCEGVDRCRITEVYEVICPATVAEALRAERPDGGYAVQPSLAAGRAMAIHRMTYTVEPDGTILCDFDHSVVMPVHLTWYLGIMAQEKCDVFGGGVHRVIPGTKAFTCQGQAYDFSRPYDTTRSPMPATFSLTPDNWLDPARPPDRQLDVLRDGAGRDQVAFACGFLPVYDAAPSIRSQNITDAGDIVASCKTYPTFAGGKHNTRPIQRMRGVAYKKYFQPKGSGDLSYGVRYNGVDYLFIDKYERNKSCLLSVSF